MAGALHSGEVPCFRYECLQGSASITAPLELWRQHMAGAESLQGRAAGARDALGKINV